MDLMAFEPNHINQTNNQKINIALGVSKRANPMNRMNLKISGAVI